jgi:hypothetical protein
MRVLRRTVSVTAFLAALYFLDHFLGLLAAFLPAALGAALAVIMWLAITAPATAPQHKSTTNHEKPIAYAFVASIFFLPATFLALTGLTQGPATAIALFAASLWTSLTAYSLAAHLSKRFIAVSHPK